MNGVDDVRDLERKRLAGVNVEQMQRRARIAGVIRPVCEHATVLGGREPGHDRETSRVERIRIDDEVIGAKISVAPGDHGPSLCRGAGREEIPVPPRDGRGEPTGISVWPSSGTKAFDPFALTSTVPATSFTPAILPG